MVKDGKSEADGVGEEGTREVDGNKRGSST